MVPGDFVKHQHRSFTSLIALTALAHDWRNDHNLELGRDTVRELQTVLSAYLASE